MQAVVTGAAGFTGTHLIEHLVAQGDEVLAITKSEWELARAAHWWAGRAAPAQLSWAVWDISQPVSASLVAQLRQLHHPVLYHLAAISYPSHCGASEPNQACREINIEGARRVARCCSDAQVSRMLFVSSAHVYGGPREREWLASEDDRPDPQSGYAKSKWEAEQAVAGVLAGGQTQLTVARVFNHTGPYQRGPLLVPEWAAQFLDTTLEEVVVRSLHTRIDLSDVRDVVKAYRLLMVADPVPDIVNVGSGRAISTRDLFDIFCDVTGRRPRAREADPTPRGGPIADLRRVKTAIPWQPSIPLRQTVAETIESYRLRRL